MLPRSSFGASQLLFGGTGILLGSGKKLRRNMELEETRCGIIEEPRCAAGIIRQTRKEHVTGRVEMWNWVFPVFGRELDRYCDKAV